MEEIIFRWMLKSRWLQHSLFWAVSWIFILAYLTGSREYHMIDQLITILFLLPVAACVYLNILFLFPFFLGRKQYLLYLVILCISVVLFTWFGMNFLRFDLSGIFPGYYFILDISWSDMLKFYIGFILVTTLLKFSKGWFLLAETRGNLERLEKEHARAELETLKSQVNPHFLFNGLNSLYSLILENSDKAPVYLLKLSEFLRYLLYETSTPSVSLEKELKMMEDYTDLQRLRAAGTARISWTVSGDPDKLQTAPLLLLPLIENCFKHGIKGVVDNAWADIRVEIKSDRMEFTARNNRGHSDTVNPGERKGIGLQNLQRRLDLLFPGNHTFRKEETANEFIVGLIVPLRHEDPLPGR
jgi:hypothetical protein